MPSARPTVKIDHLYSHSLLGHFDDIEILIMETDVDISYISENCLYQDMSSAFINIPDFNIYRCDAGRGGGVCLSARDTLKTNEMSATVAKSADDEDGWVDVQSHTLPSFTAGAIYRHPRGSF